MVMKINRQFFLVVISIGIGSRNNFVTAVDFQLGIVVSLTYTAYPY